jgi:hypothetical protein
LLLHVIFLDLQRRFWPPAAQYGGL